MEDFMNFLTESLYGDNYTRYDKNNVRKKFNPIMNGEECIKINDIKLSTAFMDCIFSLYESNIDLRKTKRNLQDKLKNTTTDKDYDWLNNKYQETLNDCDNQIRLMRDELNNQLSDEITKTTPYQNLLRKYNELSYEYRKLEDRSVKSEEFKKEIDELIHEKAELMVRSDDEIKKRIPKIETRIRKEINDENKLLQKDKNNTYKIKIKLLEKQIKKLKKIILDLNEDKIDDELSSCSSEDD